MELYIDRDAFLAGLARVQGIVERRNTPNPILSHVLLEASEGRLRLTATDTELAYIGDLVANVVAPGQLAVDAASLFQIAKVLPDTTAHLVLGAQNRLEVTSGSAWYKVVGLPAEDFPSLPDFGSRSSIKVSGKTLRYVIDQTGFVVCPDEHRTDINGGHLEVVDGHEGGRLLRMVATDGHRLSYAQTTFEGDFGMPEGMLIPRKALGEMKKLIHGDDAVELSFGETAALLTTSSARFYLRLIDGHFPDYRQVVPTSWRRRVLVSREELHSALKRVSVLANDKGRPVRFSFDSDSVTISAQHTDLGEARESVRLEMEGEPVDIGFNIRYCQEVLAAMHHENVVIELGDALSPALLREPDNDDALLIVMPMRLD